MQTNMRYWEYYNMTDTFTDLYGRSKQGDTFNRLYDLITSRENILLAYRTIKSNKGSKTEGTDGKKIDDIKTMKGEEIVSEIQRILLNYQPKKVRRVFKIGRASCRERVKMSVIEVSLKEKKE